MFRKLSRKEKAKLEQQVENAFAPLKAMRIGFERVFGYDPMTGMPSQKETQCPTKR